MSDSIHLDDANSTTRREPFPFLVAQATLPAGAQASLEADFPRYRGAGYFPYQANECGASINALVAELTSPGIANWLGERLGVPSLTTFPVMVTLCGSLNRRHGTIHTDSRSKVVSALLYLNRDWPYGSDGCLRLLTCIDDIDALVVPEVRPVYGNLVAFKRSENSFHGHLPFAGERKAIQVAWLTSEDEKLRKTRRGKASRFVKAMLGVLDARLGARRNRNASHRD